MVSMRCRLVQQHDCSIIKGMSASQEHIVSIALAVGKSDKACAWFGVTHKRKWELDLPVEMIVKSLWVSLNHLDL